MAKYRIIQDLDFPNSCQLERARMFDWKPVFYGTKEKCESALENIKKYGTYKIILLEETVP